ncbi:hypothetical protein BJ085DRAFT_34799 [Dimargaris cristalligena]|uniref:Uncharacterized protein n=1 Tax=Dimargaris cristalligena TaxID=215637 RepID=A0A4V1J3T5_9FUNG|nr:hypothetical protein BJ085DRAFT_34799 [Dimargaris cristalligena]|eukprot:RKP33179.1 hypothetical protein BJ085DRAFT_34799 [Dimargaris cristalligena]
MLSPLSTHALFVAIAAFCAVANGDMPAQADALSAPRLVRRAYHGYMNTPTTSQFGTSFNENDNNNRISSPVICYKNKGSDEFTDWKKKDQNDDQPTYPRYHEITRQKSFNYGKGSVAHQDALGDDYDQFARQDGFQGF